MLNLEKNMYGDMSNYKWITIGQMHPLHYYKPTADSIAPLSDHSTDYHTLSNLDLVLLAARDLQYIENTLALNHRLCILC